MQVEEYGTKLRRKSCRKAGVEGEAWSLDDPHKSGNIKDEKYMRYGYRINTVLHICDSPHIIFTWVKIPRLGVSPSAFSSSQDVHLPV
jgi:hypothetical protein